MALTAFPTIPVRDHFINLSLPLALLRIFFTCSRYFSGDSADVLYKKPERKDLLKAGSVIHCSLINDLISSFEREPSISSTCSETVFLLVTGFFTVSSF